MENNENIPQLSAEEQRILGSLIEKSRATPEYYPMTINSIMAASNQKSSRNPVVQYNEETITLTINSLKKKGLVSTVTGAGSRAVKYKHNLAIAYPLVPSELAILCILLLRGPQTPGEINNNSSRLYNFESLEEVQTVLDKLIQNEPPFVAQIARKPGQKEQRFIHLLGESAAQEPESKSENGISTDIENRIKQLEKEVFYLKTNLHKVLKEFGIEEEE
jgi:uncharacterized protein YceH (UPF0502 family)